MDTSARRLRLGLPLLVGLVAIVAAFAGSASIDDRTVAKRVAPGDAKALINVATSDPVARANAPRGAVEDVALIALSEGGSVRRKLDCAGCGVVESISRIDRSGAGTIKVTTNYQFVVRLRDGSRHVFDEATRRTLHLGERIHVIAGVNLPTR